MAELENKSAAGLQENTAIKTETESETTIDKIDEIDETDAATEGAGEQRSDSAQEPDQTDESVSDVDAFDITRKFKHNRPAAAGQQQQGKDARIQGMSGRKQNLVGVTDKKVETKRIIYFLALCFGITWVSEIFAVIPMYQSNDADVVKEAVNMIKQLMLTPAFSALLVRLATREGLAKSGIQFNFFEQRFLFLFGWFGMTILTFLGAAIYFLIFRDNFDPNMTRFIDSYRGGAESAGTQIDAVNIVASYKTDLLLKFFTAAVLDFINSFGEEWGFRAYLLPKLYRKFGTIRAVLMSGFASGLWYAPLVAVGYYYGNENAGFPVVNILAMCVFGMVTGVIYSFLCLRTGSIFPAVFAHSAVNVLMAQGALFTFDGGNFFVGPAPTGIVSGLPFILVAAVCLVHLHRHPVKAGE